MGVSRELQLQGQGCLGMETQLLCLPSHHHCAYSTKGASYEQFFRLCVDKMVSEAMIKRSWGKCVNSSLVYAQRRPMRQVVAFPEPWSPTNQAWTQQLSKLQGTAKSWGCFGQSERTGSFEWTVFLWALPANQYSAVPPVWRPPPRSGMP